MRLSKMTNAQVLQRFEYACFHLAHSNSKTREIEFGKMEKEIAKRLNLTEEELSRVQHEENLEGA